MAEWNSGAVVIANDDLRRKILSLGGKGIFNSPFRQNIEWPLQKATINIRDPYRPDAVVNCWKDQTGKIRRPLGYSDFTVATDMHYDMPLAKHNISYAAKFYHYCRDLRRVGESAISGYFRERAALMPWCIQSFWDAVEYGAQFNMHWQVSHGYQYTSDQERTDFEGEWAHHGQNRGLAKYIWVVELDNEYWQNGWKRWDLDKQHEEGVRIRNLWKTIFNPMPFVCMGAPSSEGPDLIEKSLLEDWVCDIHSARDREWMIKHAFGLWYMEGKPGRLVIELKDSQNRPTGQYKILPGPWFIHGEPTPIAGGEADFMGTPDGGAQIAQFMMGSQGGGAVTYFDGWDVKSAEPIEIDAPTFELWPLYAKNFPEDSCTWSPVHGGSQWHWGKPDGSGALTVLDEYWYRSYMPPKPIGQWKAYGPSTDDIGGTEILEGRGKLLLPSGFDGAIVDLEWAS